MRPSKLVAPQIGGLVARQRLFREIEQASPKGIVWITAPPGAGKTSLAATWLYSCRSAARHGHALWYRWHWRSELCLIAHTMHCQG
jgi:ATP/maltotriose-dependent transcriptional regulator MalT